MEYAKNISHAKIISIERLTIYLVLPFVSLIKKVTDE